MEKLKYIVFSDIHLHTYSGAIDAESRLSKKLLTQKNVLQQIIDLTIQEEAILLFGGDLVHSVGNIPIEVMNMVHWFFEEIKKCGIKFYATEGNHDQIIRKDCSIWHSALSPFQNRSERDRELLTMKPSIRLIDYDDIDDVEKYKGFDIVVVHAQPDLVNKHKFHMEGVNWKKLAKNNRIVMFGHDHTTRKLSPMCYVIGSPLQLTMNDVDEDRGCWIIDSETWTVTFHKLNYPELKRLEKLETKEEAKFEERIKSSSFQDILVEWLDKEQKPQEYLDLIQKDITEKTQESKTFFNGRIRNIYLKDFLSVKEITIELKNGFWLVLGENGTGKTSITGEGIYWILFEETTKNLSKSEVVRDRPDKQKEAIGILELVDDKCFYKIVRSSKKGLEIWCDEKNLVDGMTKTQSQEFLENNILGFNKSTYLAACYFSQEQLLTLAQLGDADTTNLVTNLLGFETYDSLYKLMGEKIKELTLQIGLEEDSSVNLKNSIWKNEEQFKNLNDQIVDLQKIEDSLKEEHEKVTIQIDEVGKALGNIIIPAISTEDLDKEILELDIKKTEMEKKELESNAQLAKVIQEQNKIEKEKITIEAFNLSTEENILKHEAIIKSLQENKCSYCGAIISADKLDEYLANEHSEVIKLVESIKGNTAELDKQLDSLYDQEAEQNELIYNYEHMRKEFELRIKEKQNERNNALKIQIEAEANKTNLSKQLTLVNQRELTLVNQLKNININDKLLQKKAIEDEILVLGQKFIDLQTKTYSLNKNKTIYEFWVNAFSNKGIRPLLLDRFVNEINETIKHYCYEVSRGEFLVEFSPTSKIKSGLERNKLGLQVIYKDKTINYSSLSGGEKTRANLPLCFGLNKWISNKYGVKNGILGVMVLDELFCYTDEKFRDSVAELLNEEGRNKSIFVIDHSTVLASYSNNIWNVTKENDITKLQVV